MPGETNKVGYGRPPKHSQFAPGRSGNLNGRPKGSKNMTTLLQEELCAAAWKKDPLSGVIGA
jgi:hypothetical protein